MHQIVNSTVCRMLHACLHSVIFSQLTVSKYRTINIGLQESSKHAKVELFKALNGLIGFCKCVLTAAIGVAAGLLGPVVVGPNVIYFHSAQNPWQRPWV